MTGAIEVFDDFRVMGPSPLFVVGSFTVIVIASAVAAWATFVWRSIRFDPSLVRVNVRGVDVPAILGDALLGGALTGIALMIAVSLVVGSSVAQGLAVGLVGVTMWAAGMWDDRRGDERPRGFKGHLGALRSLSVTGGLVKIAAGVVAGVVASPLIPARGAQPLAHVIETVALVALAANLVNLLDRAPGRAGKVSLLGATPLLLFGDPEWAVSAVPVFGALVYCMVPDLREEAMLGDAGANPLGAVIGVGLVASLAEPGRLIAIAVLLTLNLASEKWSFSKAIEATPPLRWLDGLGRKDEVAPK